MKQLKITLKLTVLLMVVCLMTVSCQKDDNINESIEPQNQLRKPPSYTANIFNGDSIINANPNLKNKLKRFNDKTALRTIQSAEHDFSIDTTRIQKIQTSSYISYTFTVVRPYPVDDVLENYVITHFNNDTYRQYFISYPIINNDGDISYDVSNAQISILNDESLVYSRDANCVSVMVFEEPVCVDMPCDGSPAHTFEQGSECPYWGAIGTATRECSEGGWIDPGCSDGGNVGDDNSNGDSSGDPSGDSNGGTGTNGPGNTNEDDPEEEIVIPMIPTLIQQIENCINMPTTIGAPNDTTITPGLIASLNLSPAQVMALNNYLRVQNQCSEEAQAFSIAVALAGPDAEVDWEEGIIFDNTWEDFPCHRSVVHDAIGVCSPLTGVVQSVFENNDFVYLLLTSEILPNNNAETVLNGFFTSTNTYYVKTRFNETYLNSATDLSIARTTIHESLHAIFVYMYEEGLLLSEDGSALEEYEDFVQAYINKLNELPYNFGTPGHEILAGFVDDIATSLSFYAQNVGYVNSFNYYRSLAWGGLTGTEQFNTLYPTEVNGEVNLERLKILNTIKAEALNENQYFEINGTTYEITPKGITPNQTQPCN